MLKRLRASGLRPALVVSIVLALAVMAPPAAAKLGASSCGAYPYAPCTPVVTSVNPHSGPTTGGTSVTITGQNFANATSVTFGGVPATSFIVVSDTQITAVSPAHSPGTVDVQVTTFAGTSATGPNDHFRYSPPAVFKPHQPHRLLDTRLTHTTLGPNSSLNLPIAGLNGVAANATAAVLNVTATNTTLPSFLIIYPTGSVRPTASNLNWVKGETVPNLVSATLGTGGAITIYNGNGKVDVVVDLEGSFEAPTVATDGEFVPLTPARITDTRSGSGKPNAGNKLGQGQTLDVQVTGVGGVPSTGAEAVVLNVTAVNETTAGFFTVYPTGGTLPTASNLNWTPGKVVPNRVVVPIGTGGKVSIYNGPGKANVVVDVNGYFTDTTAAGSVFSTLDPSRILDTRNGTGGFSTKVGPGGSISLAVAGQGGVPSMVSATPPTAVILNVTVVNNTAPSFLIIWPDGVARPLASDLNFVAGQTVPNLVVVKVGSNGRVDIYNGFGKTDIVVDVEGWFGG